jgi:dihydroxyacid dehydratase/phosphogluconate dehydratase
VRKGSLTAEKRRKSGARKTQRSARWFAPDDLRAFGHRSRAMQMGSAPHQWRTGLLSRSSARGRTRSHLHFKSRVDDVRRGVLKAGGLPDRIAGCRNRR